MPQVLKPSFLVRRFDGRFAVQTFQAQDAEVVAGDRVEMVGEGCVDERSGNRTGDGDHLGRQFFGQHHFESAGNLTHEPQ